MKPWIAFQDGEIPEDVLRAILQPCESDNAKAWQKQVSTNLRQARWVVDWEVELPGFYYGEASGYLDLVASKDGVRIAIELDNKRPREKSIAKVKAFGGIQIVACRGSYSVDPAILQAWYRDHPTPKKGGAPANRDTP